jgi:hypothetical protein
MPKDATGIKERPILFSAPMVRALIDGSKTQTRRIVKPQPHSAPSFSGGYAVRQPKRTFANRQTAGELSVECPYVHQACPYGQPGDRLWVRETWAQPAALDPGPTVYRADYPACVPAQYENVPPAEQITWKPSIHMFRKDSRILLEIVSVRVERLQDISEADARAEGITPHEVRQFAIFGASEEERAAIYRDAAVGPYRGLWQQINGPGSWDANPWVWVVEFRRVP